MSGFEGLPQVKKTFKIFTDNNEEYGEANAFPRGETVSEGSTEINGDTPIFTLVDVEEDLLTSYAGAYTPNMVVIDFMADTDMLLNYMAALCDRYKLALSFKVCGVDTDVFDRVATDDVDGGSPKVHLTRQDKEASNENGIVEYNHDCYEKLEVDGQMFLSCVSRSHDPEYLHKIMSEATESLYVNSKYIFTMIGPRPIYDEESGRYAFLDTLRLNTYEMSALTSHIGKLEGVRVSYGKHNGRSAIIFIKE